MSSKRRDWCKHYRAMARFDTCLAGVTFESLKPIKSDMCPCFDQLPNSKDLCSLSEYRTAEEKEADRIMMEQHFQRTIIARQAIVEACGGPWKRGMVGSAGVISCPVCGGQKTLQFSRSGYNGHIHAACETENCVRWME